MRTEAINIYKFSELSDQAKQVAIDKFRDRGEFFWADEWWQSAQEFCRIAPVEMIRADMCAGHVDMAWRGECEGELSGVRAWKWLLNNGWFDLARENARGGCTLTGYLGDCDLFDPIEQYEKTPAKIPELRQVFYECLQSWAFAAQRDYEWQQSDEYIAEDIEANEWEFLECGEVA